MEFVYELNCLADYACDQHESRSISEEIVDICDRTWVQPEGSGIQRLLTLDDYPMNEATDSVDTRDSNEDESEAPMEKDRIAATIPRGPYRIYTFEQRVNVLWMVINSGTSAAEAGRRCGVKERTAQDWVRKYKNDPEQRVPRLGNKKAMNSNQKLFDEHSSYLVSYYEAHPEATLRQARDALCTEFEGLTITLAGLQKHLVKKCSLTLKKLEKLPAARNSDRVVEQRFQAVSEWMADEKFNFSEAVFIDEAGFNLHIRRNFGRSKRGMPAKTTVPTNRGISLTILGAICNVGVINVSLRKPEAISSKKRKHDGKATVHNARIGTRTEHYKQFICGVLDVLDAHNF